MGALIVARQGHNLLNTLKIGENQLSMWIVSMIKLDPQFSTEMEKQLRFKASLNQSHGHTAMESTIQWIYLQDDNLLTV